MAFVAVSSGTAIFDNRFGDAPRDWSELLPQSLVIPEGSWFSSGQIQLQLQTFISVVIEQTNQRRNTERFLNPTQLQIGHISWLSQGFVVTDERIKYERQAHSYLSPVVELSNTRQDNRIEMGATTNTRSGHAQTNVGVPVCGTIRGLVPPPPSLAALELSGSIGLGAICMTTSIGALELAQLDVFSSFVPKELVIETKDLLLPDEIAGVVWTGYQLELGWLMGYHQEASTARANSPSPQITGDAQGAVYNYTCNLGLSVPNPLGCVPPQIPFLQYNQNGQPVWTCIAPPT